MFNRDVRETWIRAKYARKAFVNQQLVPTAASAADSVDDGTVSRPSYSKWRVVYRQKKSNPSQRPIGLHSDGDILSPSGLLLLILLY